MGKGGTGTFLIDGIEAGKGRIENTNAKVFSLDEGADVGQDEATNQVKITRWAKPISLLAKLNRYLSKK